jgi:amidohydrolase
MPQDELKSAILQRVPALSALRRHYHAHPELSFEERETAAAIATRLRELGLETRDHVGGEGVVGVLRGTAGDGGGRTLMVRADIDALPIEELTDAEYRSQLPGVMHACGHDGHIAIALTLAEILAERRDQLRGAVVFAFQPAEERAAGAGKMIEEGALDAPKVDAVIGLHLWSTYPVGKIAVQPGAVMASADEIILQVRGHGGHGAVPHEAVDPIVAAAQIVVASQTLVSREVSPFHPAVLTWGAISGGTAFNIIADEVELRGTLRTYDEADRAFLKKRLAELASGVAQGMRAEAQVTVGLGTGSCVNDTEMARLVRAAAEATVGRENVPTEDMRLTPSDDMSVFLAALPGCYFFVGAGNVERGITAPHHNARFEIDEAALAIGVETLARATLAHLAPEGAEGMAS